VPAQLRRQARHHAALALDAPHALGRDDRFKKAYFSEFHGKPGVYFTGDGARQDKDGYFWTSAASTTCSTSSGHRIGTAEIESALVSHPAVAEAARGRRTTLKGQSLRRLRHVK